MFSSRAFVTVAMAVWMCKHGEWVKCHHGCAFVQKDMLVLTRHYKTAHGGTPVPYNDLVIIQDAECKALVGAAAFEKLKKDPKNEWPANLPYPPRPRSKGSRTTARASPHVRSAEAPTQVASTSTTPTSSNGQVATLIGLPPNANPAATPDVPRHAALSSGHSASRNANNSPSPHNRQSIGNSDVIAHAQPDTSGQALQPSTTSRTFDPLSTDSQAGVSAVDEVMSDAPQLAQTTIEATSDSQTGHTSHAKSAMGICEIAGNTSLSIAPPSTVISITSKLAPPVRKAQPSLLGIPSEVRESIYRYSIGPVTRWHSDIFQSEKEDFSLALSGVSRQLRIEVVRFLTKTFGIVRLRVDTMRDSRGMRAGLVSDVFGKAPLFLLNPELHTDVALPKLTPLLQLKLSLEHPRWSDMEPVLGTLDAFTSTQEPATEQDALGEPDYNHLDTDISSEEPFNTWAGIRGPLWCPNSVIRQRYTQELTFLFSRESLHILLEALYDCSGGREGIEYLEVDFSVTQPTPTQIGDIQSMVDCLRTSIDAPIVKIKGLPLQQTEVLHTIMTTPRENIWQRSWNLQLALKDLSARKYVSAFLALRHDSYLLADHISSPSSNIYQGALLTNLVRRRHNLNAEAICLTSLICTKAHNRRLQQILASGSLDRLSPLGLQRALQIARHTYTWIGLTDAQRADASWECGLMHRFLAQIIAVPNNKLSAATPSPALTSQRHWRSVYPSHDLSNETGVSPEAADPQHYSTHHGQRR